MTSSYARRKSVLSLYTLKEKTDFFGLFYPIFNLFCPDSLKKWDKNALFSKTAYKYFTICSVI